ncbi:RDD family protein [Pasteurellaceae bacterium 22721_9_1]
MAAMLVENPKTRKKQSKNTIEFNSNIHRLKQDDVAPQVRYRTATFFERLSAVLLNLFFLFLFVHLFKIFIPIARAGFIAFLCYVLFQLILMKIWGQTLGKKMMKIHVSLRNSEDKLSFGNYIWREIKAFYLLVAYLTSALFYMVLFFKFIFKLIDLLRGRESVDLSAYLDTDDVIVLKEIKIK